MIPDDVDQLFEITLHTDPFTISDVYGFENQGGTIGLHGVIEVANDDTVCGHYVKDAVLLGDFQ